MSATSSDRTPALADPSTICGAPSPSVRELEASQAAREAFINGNAGNERFGPTKIVIPVHFVCVHDDTTGMLNRSVFQSQFEVLNERFARSVNGGVSVAFEHNGVSYVNDAHLFRSLQYHTDPSLEDWARQATEKASLTATPDRLRFFTCQCDDGLLGWANIPLGVSGSGRQVGSYGDAAFMSYNTLPGAPGAREPFHLGITGLHEVGHWLGLFHTFQGGCLGGDNVHDTPAHEYSKAWCHGKPDPKDRNGACCDDERAPVKNYMNYTDDDWMDNFTPQQLERVRDVAQWLRPGTIANASERVRVIDLSGARDRTIEKMRHPNADRLERVQAMERLSIAKLHVVCKTDCGRGVWERDVNYDELICVFVTEACTQPDLNIAHPGLYVLVTEAGHQLGGDLLWSQYFGLGQERVEVTLRKRDGKGVSATPSDGASTSTARRALASNGDDDQASRSGGGDPLPRARRPAEFAPDLEVHCTAADAQMRADGSPAHNAEGGFTHGARTHAAGSLTSRIDEADRLKPRTKVGVIGAGVTGLTVAYHLLARGHDVVVLEKSSVVGGRIQTLHWEGVHAELGAMRIPAAHDLTRQWVSILGLDLVPFENSTKMFVYFNDDKRFEAGQSKDSLVNEILCTNFPGLMDDERNAVKNAFIGGLWFEVLERNVINQLNAAERSVLFSLEKIVEGEHPVLFNLEKQSLKDWLLEMQELGELSESGVKLIMYGLTLKGYETTSMLMFLREELDESFLDLDQIPTGMGALINGIADLRLSTGRKGTHCVRDHVQLSRTVTEIAAVEHGVRVKCDGDEIDFDRVVCTAMLPDLRNSQVAIEDTLCDTATREAINNIQYMYSYKALLKFNSRPWVTATNSDGQLLGQGGQVLSNQVLGQLYFPGHGRPDRAMLLAMYRWGIESLRGEVDEYLGSNTDQRKMKLVAEVKSALGVGTLAREVGEALADDPLVEKRWFPAFQGIKPGDERYVHGMVAHLCPKDQRTRLYFAGEHLSPHPSWIQGSLWSALHVTATLLDDSVGDVSYPADVCSVADYLVKRLKEIGVAHVFGVAGDYTFTFLDKCAEQDVEVVPTCNELNAAYAADGYARLRGFGVCTGTFGVGALSLLSPVGGAWTENVPLLVVNGGPSRVHRIEHAQTDKLFHHASGSLDNDRRAFEPFTQEAMILDSEATAVGDIDKALLNALLHKKPVYIELPVDMWNAQCKSPQDPLLPPQYASFDHRLSLTMQKEIHDNSIEAIEALLHDIHTAKHPLILAGVELHRYGLGSQFERLLDVLPCNYYTTLLGKSIISESHTSFRGVYEGVASVDRVRVEVENKCDLLIALGARMSDDVTAGTRLNFDRIAVLNTNKVSIGNNYYRVLSLRVFIEGMVERAKELHMNAAHTRSAHVPYPLAGPSFQDLIGEELESGGYQDNSEQIKYESFMMLLRRSRLLGLDARVYVDTCNAQFISGDLPIHRAGGFVGAVAWGAIGQSLPSCLGGSLADASAMPVVILGDGGFQMTCQAISTIARYQIPCVIILFNNNTYGIEQAIIDGGIIKQMKEYNRIAQWDYKQLLKALTNNKGHFRAVLTVGEARGAIQEAAALQRQQQVVLIQVHVAENDVPAAVTRVFGGTSEQQASDDGGDVVAPTKDDVSFGEDVVPDEGASEDAHDVTATLDTAPLPTPDRRRRRQHARQAEMIVRIGPTAPHLPHLQRVMESPSGGPSSEFSHVSGGASSRLRQPLPSIPSKQGNCCAKRFGVPYSDAPASGRRTSAGARRAIDFTRLTPIVDMIEEGSIFTTVSKLAGDHARRVSHTHEYKRCAEWIQKRLPTTLKTSLVRFDYTWERHQHESYNVRAVLHGQHRVAGSRSSARVANERKIVVICAHLDSVNWEDLDADAPGADDNASGSAVLLEAARVLAKHGRFEHDIEFVWFGGEEFGLHGSKAYVSAMRESQRRRILAVVNMDMVGCVNDAANGRGVLLEGQAGLSEGLFQVLHACAVEYSSELKLFVSRDPSDSDHVPFIDADIPAVLTIEHGDRQNTRPHTSRDTLDTLDANLMYLIARMNIAAVAAYAGVVTS